MSINVDGSFVHKLIAFLLLLVVFIIAGYGLVVTDDGSGFYVLSMVTFIILSCLFSLLFLMYLFFAVFRSDRYTLQEWIESL